MIDYWQQNYQNIPVISIKVEQPSNQDSLLLQQYFNTTFSIQKQETWFISEILIYILYLGIHFEDEH